MLEITMAAPPVAITRPNSSRTRAVPSRSTLRTASGAPSRARVRRLGRLGQRCRAPRLCLRATAQIHELTRRRVGPSPCDRDPQLVCGGLERVLVEVGEQYGSAGSLASS